MGIKANVGLGPIEVLAGDTTLIDPTGESGTAERVSVNCLSVHNDGSAGGPVTISIYISPDTTSAAGERVARYVIGDGASIDIVELIGQGLEDLYIIGVGNMLGLIATPTITEYDGGS